MVTPCGNWGAKAASDRCAGRCCLSRPNSPRFQPAGEASCRGIAENAASACRIRVQGIAPVASPFSDAQSLIRCNGKNVVMRTETNWPVPSDCRDARPSSLRADRPISEGLVQIPYFWIAAWNIGPTVASRHFFVSSNPFCEDGVSVRRTRFPFDCCVHIRTPVRSTVSLHERSHRC